MSKRSEERMKGTQDHWIQIYEEMVFLKVSKFVPYSFSRTELGPMCGSYIEADFSRRLKHNIPVIRNL